METMTFRLRPDFASRRSIMVSPDDKQAFVAALLKRMPALQVARRT
jgi:hypothetical protein